MSRILNDDGVSKNKLIHRLIALTFLPNPEGHADVGHLNGNPADSRLCNLKWMSKSENLGMMKEHGTQFVATKLTLAQVTDIRHQLANGVKQVEIAKRYNVSGPTISDIYTGRTWKHDWR